MSEGYIRPIHRSENFRAGALALFPQCQSFLHSIFLAVQATALNGTADKRLLVRGKINFHRLR